MPEPTLFRGGFHERLRQMPTLSNDDMQALLAKIEFFEGCTESQLRDVAHLAGERRIATGDDLCQQGDFENDVFVVVEGKADVIVHGSSVGTTEIGEIVGELSCSVPESAPSPCVRPCRCTFLCSIPEISIPFWRPTRRRLAGSASTAVRRVRSVRASQGRLTGRAQRRVQTRPCLRLRNQLRRHGWRLCGDGRAPCDQVLVGTGSI